MTPNRVGAVDGAARPEGVERAFVAPPEGELPDDPEELLRLLVDPETRGELYPLYRRLREVAPVHRTEVAGLPPGCWVLTSYAAVDRVARSAGAVNDPATVTVFDHDGRRGPFFRVMATSMLFLEKPAHDRVRRLVHRAFTPRSVEPLGPLTASLADDLVDRVASAGAMDLVDAFTYPLPIRAICQLLGLPPDAQGQIEAWAWDFARAGDPMTVTPAAARAGDAAASAFCEFFERQLWERRRAPTGDIMSTLATADEAGEPLGPEEAVSTCILLLQAGHETTTDLLGNSILHLFRNPQEREWLRAHPEEMRNAVEELLRFDGSVQMSMRLATEDIDVEGTTVPEGSLLALVYGAANHDPTVFADPDRLDLTRRPQHLAFSAGAYYCLGSTLARVEVAAALEVLLRRLPDLAPIGQTFLQRRSLRMRGPLEVQVCWDPDAARS